MIDDLQGLVTVERFEGGGEAEIPPGISGGDLVNRYLRVGEAHAYFTALLDDRRARPAYDLTSAMLLATNADGTPAMTDDYVLGHMVGLAVAGSSTTADLIAQMVRFLAETPSIRARILRRPELWDGAVEEGVRRFAVATNLPRVTTREIEVGDTRIPPRSAVLLNVPGANGNAHRFPDPLGFDLNRSNTGDHLGFGLGRHFCLGAPLARLEARCSLEELFSRIPDLRIAPDQHLRYKPAITVRALEQLNVTW
jgi:cytochrome P450